MKDLAKKNGTTEKDEMNAYQDRTSKLMYKNVKSVIK